MHGDLLRQWRKNGAITSALQFHQNSDFTETRRLRIVNIRPENPILGFELRDTSNVHILANGGDHLNEFVSDGSSGRGIRGRG